MSKEEEDFHRALRKAQPGKALKTWAPILVAGVVGLISFLAVSLLWPLDTIPVVILFGVPVVVAGGVLVALQKMLGTK